MQLNETEKIRIRHHLGYAQVRSGAAFSLGFPATIETAFQIELAMNQVKDEALGLIRELINVCDSIEAQMIEDHELLAVTKVGEIEIQPKEQEKLDLRYDRWVGKLANALVVSRNPFDASMGPGVNVGVRH